MKISYGITVHNEADELNKLLPILIHQSDEEDEIVICDENGEDVYKVIYLTEDNIRKTVEGKIMDDLGLNKMCCRRHMLTHVDIE